MASPDDNFRRWLGQQFETAAGGRSGCAGEKNESLRWRFLKGCSDDNLTVLEAAALQVVQTGLSDGLEPSLCVSLTRLEAA